MAYLDLVCSSTMQAWGRRENFEWSRKSGTTPEKSAVGGIIKNTSRFSTFTVTCKITFKRRAFKCPESKLLIIIQESSHQFINIYKFFH